VIELPLRRAPTEPITVLCLGAHSDDIEIGCGGTILNLTALYPKASLHWIVFSADDRRRVEALAGAELFLQGAARKEIVVERFRESYFPYAGEAIKDYFEALKAAVVPDLIFTHYRFDLHQDHRLISDLTWNTFRGSLILEYEIPKWDGDLGAPNCFVRLTEETVERKARSICETFASQRAKPWFTEGTFRALARLRGIEADAHFAEAFYARKINLCP
jgi:LmbE family N-acetylglucosaminyl deacetylase